MKYKIFKGITNSQLKNLESNLPIYIKEYTANTKIITSSDKINNIYLIESGSVLALQYDYWGNRNIIEKFCSGEYFAFAIPFLQNNISDIDVITDEKTTLKFFDAKKLISVCINLGYENLIFNILEELSIKNHLLIKKLKLLSQKTLKQSIILFLSEYATKNKSNTFTIPLNRQEMADYFYVDRAGLSTVLSKMKKENLIDYKKNTFTLIKNS